MNSDARHLTLPADFFRGNRTTLLEQIPEPCFVIVYAGNPVALSADTDYRYSVNRNFYYLTGIQQSGSVLVMSKSAGKVNETLFIHPTDPIRERWNGKLMAPEEVKTLSSINEICWLPAYEDRLSDILNQSGINFCLDFSNHRSEAQALRGRISELIQNVTVTDISSHLTRMRMVKQSCEIKAIESAIELTGNALAATAKKMSESVSELLIYADLDYEMAKQGCLIPAFTTIAAGGENTLCLHYIEPDNQRLAPGTLVQVDIGGVAGGYSADISRVFPIGGRFSTRQKQLYQIVRACQEKAFSTIKPGVTLADIKRVVSDVAVELLRDMGVLSSDQDISSYVWHNSAHHLGLDVHDVSFRYEPLCESNVLAVEPGIYIPEWGFGFRIEDDVLVTADGCRLLSSRIPVNADEIERMILS